ncbi:MAG TPA: hypothetical protein VI956_00195, partial [Nitrospirota bacterium]|nr:hypothetical protein [Nitrospirota bacterium]
MVLTVSGAAGYCQKFYENEGAWYETGAVSPGSPSSPAHNAPDDRQYSKRRGLDPAALSLRPCCFGV